jgi:hypothetical protein
MRSQFGLALSLAVAVTTVLPAAPAMAQSDPQVQRAISFREEFGFNSDPSYVSVAEANVSLSNKHGARLTGSEEADLNRRLVVETELPRLEAALDKEPSFGGMYIDQKDGGAVDIWIVGDQTAAATVVTANAPAGARVHILPATYSARSLQQLQEKVLADWPAWKARGVVISAQYVDAPTNRLLILVQDLKDFQAQALENAYGDAVRVEAGGPVVPLECTGVAKCPPAKGGYQIYTSGATCTASYMARSTTTHALYLVTAGHCSALNTVWYHYNARIGVTAARAYSDGKNSDAELILLDQPVPAIRNQMLLTSSSNGSVLGVVSIVGWTYGSQQTQYPGGQVCSQSRLSGLRCGVVSVINADFGLPGVGTFHHMNAYNWVSGNADSGAAVIAPNDVMYGSVSGYANGNTYYSAVDWIANDLLSAYPCYTSDC